MGPLASAFHPSLFYGVPLVVAGLAAWANAERHGAAGTAAGGGSADLRTPLAASEHGGGRTLGGNVNGVAA